MAGEGCLCLGRGFSTDASNSKEAMTSDPYAIIVNREGGSGAGGRGERKGDDVKRG
jgi:hypothetical protein